MVVERPRMTRDGGGLKVRTPEQCCYTVDCTQVLDFQSLTQPLLMPEVALYDKWDQ